MLAGADIYMTVQLLLLSLLVLTVSATRAASVKASLTPRFFMAEHSSRRLANESLKSHRVLPATSSCMTCLSRRVDRVGMDQLVSATIG